MKRHLKFLVLMLSLFPACSTVAQAGSNEELFAAVKSINTHEVRRLLAAGADSNGRDDLGATPLFWAAVSGSKEIAELLIARAADINARDRSGFTPLHAAAYQSRGEVAELLVRSGAEVNVRSADGWTPLHKAMERFSSGAVPHRTTPSDVAAMVSVVEVLLANGADANARNTSDETPLHYAAASGQRALGQLLISRGANIDPKNKEGVTPLYIAVKMDRAEFAELLIARGAEIDARTKSGYTPLIWAAHTGNRDIVNLLITHRSNVNAKDNNGRTALLWALLTASYARMFSFSPPAYASRQLSEMSAAQQRESREELQKMKGRWREVAKLLVDNGSDIAADSLNNSPLYYAALIGDKDLVEVLIDRGGDINESKGGETALHAAIAEKHREVAEWLITGGANVNARNMSGRSPLHFLAFYIDDRKLAELMIERGADINARDKNGETPLTFATKSGNHQVAAVLRESTRAQQPSGPSSVHMSPLAKDDSVDPDDQSLTPDQYVQMGMPSHDRRWSSEDMVSAAKVLRILAQKNPRSLPRHNSERSGEVFARLVALDNLKPFMPESPSIEDRMLMAAELGTGFLQSWGQIYQIYAISARAGAVRSSDLVEFGGFLLRALAAMSRLLNEDVMALITQTLKKIPQTDPKHMAAVSTLDEFDKARQYLSLTFMQILRTVAGRPEPYRISDLAKLVQYAIETAPSILRWVMPTTRTEALVLVERMLKDAHEDLRPGLQQLYGEIRRSTDKPEIAGKEIPNDRPGN